MPGLNRLAAAFCLAFWVLSLAACQKLGPDYTRPELGYAIPDHFLAGPAPGEPKPDGRWWQDFSDPELNRLVDRAIERNYNLLAATARIKQAAAQLIRAEAAELPTLDGSAKARKARASAMETDSLELSVAAGYEIDLWGKLARATEAARADLLAVEANRAALAQTLVAETCRIYMDIQVTRQRVDIARRRVESLAKSQKIIELRYKRGISNLLALRQARRALLQSRADIPSLELRLGKSRQALAILCGDYPSAGSIAKEKPQEYLSLLKPVPAGLPSDLLKQRPDLIKAEAELMAANARVGQAVAARYPAIRLTGSAGYASDEIDSLFTPTSLLWKLAAGITQPLFDGGDLKAAELAARANWEAQAADYAQAVLQAFGETEDALLSGTQNRLRRQELTAAFAEAKHTMKAAGQRYLRGLTDYLNVLEAQQTRYNIEDSLAVNQLAILENRISLHRALGGGWMLNLPSVGENANKEPAP